MVNWLDKRLSWHAYEGKKFLPKGVVTQRLRGGGAKRPGGNDLGRMERLVALWDETIRQRNGFGVETTRTKGETTRKETTRGGKSWERNVLLPRIFVSFKNKLSHIAKGQTFLSMYVSIHFKTTLSFFHGREANWRLHKIYKKPALLDTVLTYPCLLDTGSRLESVRIYELEHIFTLYKGEHRKLTKMKYAGIFT